MRFLILVVSLMASTVASANLSQTFTIENIGASNNTNTVFVNVVEQINDSTCGNKKQLKISLDDKLADKFYSAVLMAYAAGKQITIYYKAEGCTDSGTTPNVFMIE